MANVNKNWISMANDIHTKSAQMGRASNSKFFFGKLLVTNDKLMFFKWYILKWHRLLSLVITRWENSSSFIRTLFWKFQQTYLRKISQFNMTNNLFSNLPRVTFFNPIFKIIEQKFYMGLLNENQQKIGTPLGEHSVLSIFLRKLPV